MKIAFYLVSALIFFVTTISAQSIPKELWGNWVVTRELPATTISCWGEKQASGLLGTKIEYSADMFRRKDIVTRHPVAQSKIITAKQFHAENSGQGANSSQVAFPQLGIKAKEAKQISIEHPPASITAATTEIPGDEVLNKDNDTIIFSICNVFFEAKRVVPPHAPNR